MFRKTSNTRLLGKSKELLAAGFLRRQGLKLIRSNYCCRAGEIDLIFLDRQRQLLFVEVRYRRSDSYGSALESIDLGKQRKIRRTAAYFLQCNPGYSRLACRFDVIAVNAGSGSDRLQWIKNAFY